MNEDQELEALRQLEEELKAFKEEAEVTVAESAMIEEPATATEPAPAPAPKKAKKVKEEKVEVKGPAPQKATAVPTYAAERIRARLIR